jgi:hypothetical protein
MKLTFLGHQGWAIEAADGLVLIDPLHSGMGNGDTIMPVWPGRTLELGHLTNIAAVIVSHEHGDHFDIRTLQELPKSIDVFIPDRAPSSLRGALAALGFSVTLMQPFVPLRVGGVKVTALPTAPSTLERDVYGLLFEGDSAERFLTFVDGVPSLEALAWLERHASTRTLDNFTNNCIRQIPHLSNILTPDHTVTTSAMRGLLDFVDNFTPCRVVISGLGWSYGQRLAPLNRAVFVINNSQIEAAARALFPLIDWHCPAPGDSFLLTEHELTPTEHARWVKLDPNPLERGRSEEAAPLKPGPFSGTDSLDDPALRIVQAFVLDEFGRVMCDSSPTLDEALGKIARRSESQHVPRLFLRILNGNLRFDFELWHAQRRFVPVQATRNPAETHIAGFEVWASDLDLLLRAEEEAHIVYEASVRAWNHDLDVLPYYLQSSLFAWFHPYFRPDAFLAAYRRMRNLPMAPEPAEVAP